MAVLLALASALVAQITHTPGPQTPITLAAGEMYSLEIAAPFPSRDIGLWFEGDLGDAQIELSAQGEVIETWPLFVDHDQAPEHFSPGALAARPAGAKSVTGLVHSYGLPADAARLFLFGPATIRSLDFVWIAPGNLVEQPANLPASLGLAAGYPKPPVSSRASWGADSPQCGSSYCTTTHMGVHHTASSADYGASTWSQAAANVKSIQSYHMYTNGWCDIGYNYLVSKQGWIFEGRGGGDDVKGAHDGFNCGSMGVASLGYFHTPVNNQTTSAQLDALKELGAWKFDQGGIDPLGSSWYAGLGATEQNVYGHRDVKATACPGDLLYAKLGEIRSGIEARLQQVPTSGTLKGVLYDAALGLTARLVGTVALANGEFVKTGSDGYFEFPLPAGTYGFAATAPGHNARSASETVTTGDVWESIGLDPGNVPVHTSTSTGSDSFQAVFQGNVGSPVFLGYATTPAVPTLAFGTGGQLWINPQSAQILALGSVPGSGALTVNLVATGVPVGTVIYTQGYLAWQGAARLTNGAAWRAE
ncbi:MAG: hypothetical protein ACJAVJ_001903 [Planctomycetota bacterium]|jgi:hypothetical protein